MENEQMSNYLFNFYDENRQDEYLTEESRLRIADWHISELVKAEAKGRKEAAREILNYSNELIVDIEDIKEKCQSILNEGANK